MAKDTQHFSVYSMVIGTFYEKCVFISVTYFLTDLSHGWMCLTLEFFTTPLHIKSFVQGIPDKYFLFFRLSLHCVSCSFCYADAPWHNLLMLFLMQMGFCLESPVYNHVFSGFIYFIFQQVMSILILRSLIYFD